jgi:transposase
MKFVKNLNEAERRTLLDAIRYAPWPRFRQRAHAVLLSAKGYPIAQLADILDADRDTVSGWLDAWEQFGLLGLRDRDHPGRPRKGTEADREHLFQAVQAAPHQLRALPLQFQERTGFGVAGDDPALAERARLDLEALPAQPQGKARLGPVPGRAAGVGGVPRARGGRRAGGLLSGESGFSSSSCMPYAWQPKGETRCLSANVPGRTNVIGFLSRDHDSYFHVVDGTVTHRQVKDAMDGFIRARRPDQLTIVVMDNASIHHKAVAEGQWAWLGHKVWAWFLPAYSPELNPIEMLWKKIKYEWLPWTAYQCFETMRTALNEIFQNLGGKYRINFA